MKINLVGTGISFIFALSITNKTFKLCLITKVRY